MNYDDGSVTQEQRLLAKQITHNKLHVVYNNVYYYVATIPVSV